MEDTSPKSVETKRLMWRCRRGMLELDVVLKAFLTEHPQLTDTELQALDGFLELPDQVFWGLISGLSVKGLEPADLTADLSQSEQALLTKIRKTSHDYSH